MVLSKTLIINKIKHKLIISLAFPILIFFSVAVFHQLGKSFPLPGNFKIWGIVLFVLSVSCGAALPILIRSVFYNRFVQKSEVQAADYISHEKWLIILCSLSLFFASLAYLFIVSPLYLYGSVLAALYGIYGVLPFRSKIDEDLKTYKIQVKK